MRSFSLNRDTKSLLDQVDPPMKKNFTSDFVQQGMAMSGPTSSTPLVVNMEKIIDHCLNNGSITISQLLTATKYLKKFNIKSSQAAQETYDQDEVKRKKASEGALLNQYMNSKPTKAKADALPHIKSLSDAFNRAAVTLGVDSKCISWGNIVRTELFVSFGNELIREFSSSAIPKAKLFLQGVLWINVGEFDQVQMIVVERWNAIISLMESFTASRFLVFLPEKQMIPGTDKYSSDGQWMLTKGAVTALQKVAGQDMSFAEIGRVSMKDINALVGKGKNLTAVEQLTLLSACTVVDIRTLTQCVTFRKNKSNMAIKEKIAEMMAIAINLAGNKYNPGDVSLNTDHEFTKTYFKSLSMIRASIRGFNAQLYGSKGGPDTRTGYLQTKVSAVTGFSLTK